MTRVISVVLGSATSTLVPRRAGSHCPMPGQNRDRAGVRVGGREGSDLPCLWYDADNSYPRPTRQGQAFSTSSTRPGGIICLHLATCGGPWLRHGVIPATAVTDRESDCITYPYW